jgi:alcohol dehydrogenase class IV
MKLTHTNLLQLERVHYWVSLRTRGLSSVSKTVVKIESARERVCVPDFIFAVGWNSWADAAKFLTGFSAVGSIAIPTILRHAQLIESGAMWIEFASFFVVLATVMLFQHVSQEEEYY